MARIKLTDRTVTAIRPPVRGPVDYFDARLPGFALRITRSGHKSWVVMYRHGRRLRRLTLGAYPQLGLADARAKGRAALRAAAHGQDPAEEKQAERRAETFAELAEEYLERHAKPNKRSWREDQRILQRELLPPWRHTNAKAITRRHVRKLLDVIIERGARIQANRTFALARKVFNFGIQRDLVEVNPCHGLMRPAQEHQRDRVLSPAEIRLVWQSLEHRLPSTAAAIRLLFLTAQRVSEVLTMRWADVDLDSGWWTIPAERSKNHLPHRVPVSPQARAVMDKLQGQRGDSPWVFPNRQGDRPMVTIKKAVTRIRAEQQIEFTPHDLRRTAASHITGMGISRLTVARILNHAERDITAVYDRHSYDPEKRQALDAWCVRLEEIVHGTPKPAKVVSLFRA